MTKKWKNVPIETFGSYTTLKEALEILQRAKDAELKGEFRNIYLRIEEDFGSYYVYLFGERPETEAEEAKRLAEEERMKLLRREQYEQLKKEFGE